MHSDSSKNNKTYFMRFIVCFHFELFVTAPTEKPLGSMIAAFKSQCTKEYWLNFSESNSEPEKESMFLPGFNDKIAFQAGTKDAFYNYK